MRMPVDAPFFRAAFSFRSRSNSAFSSSSDMAFSFLRAWFAPTVAARPEWTARTRLTLGIVDALFMRTSNDAFHHRDRMRSVAAQKIHHLLAGCTVGPNVAGFAKPSAQLSRFAVGRRKDANNRLAGAHIVGTVECNSSEGITPKPVLAFFCSHLLACGPTFIAYPFACWQIADIIAQPP